MVVPSSGDRIGLVLADRYRLVAKVGTGPSATVYLADDVRLRRRVAVKLLAESLADEGVFVGRFGAEMQSASALRHPHIAMIHDWGVADVPYVVGEYLEGGSLRRLLDGGRTLSPSQGLQTGLAAARALAYAHERGVVHRDLDPTDLLFAADGRLKITDFGLARAFAEAASTHPMGAGAASVRYAAPEQALGHSVDGRADVYALALVLIEAVCGVVPFAADTALATLMGRVDRSPVLPAELGALADPLARATVVDPVDRLDAAGLVMALMAVADAFDDPEPLVLSPTTVGASTRDVASPVDELELDDITLFGVPFPGGDEPEVPDGSGHPGRAGAGEPGSGRSDPAPGSTGGGAPDAGPVDAGHVDDVPLHDVPLDGGPPDAEDAGRRNRRRWRVAWAVLAVVVIVGGGAVGALVWQARRTPTHLVPAVTSSAPARAEARLRALGFEVATRRVRRDGTRAGQVLGTEPSTGKRLAEGKTVTLVVSDGQSLVAVPADVAGVTEAVAASRLTRLGFAVGATHQDYSEDVAAGDVVGTVPGAHTRLEKGSTVALVVSKGPKPRVVPAVSGMTPDQAKAALNDLGLVPNVVERYDTKVDKGGLIGLDPGPGATVARGATVDVVVSKGLLVAVPSLGGAKTVAAAMARLESAGLVANVLTGSGKLNGKPVAFDPGSGTMVPKGSPVDIVVE